MLTRRFLLAGFAFAALPLPLQAQQSDLMSADEVHRLAASGEIVLIDVRTPQEWKTTGVAENAHTIAMQDPALGNKLASVTGGDIDRPIALICATGIRSGRVASVMARAGYTKVYSVDEGMHGSASGPGWLRRGLPLVQAH